jgi:hypothetical protein
VAPINGRIRGAIRWPDGRLFTGPFQLLATRDGGGLGGVTITVTDGRFDQAIPSGTWRLVGGGSGVAAVMTPEHTLHPYQTIENMEVVVDTGDSVDVRVVDERGEPVAHADVTVTIAHWKQGPTQRCVTDADGRGQLEHIGHARLTARVLAEGFEIGGDHEVIEPGKPLVIRVRREAKLAGTVVDDAGQPVERARVRVVGHSSPLGLTWSGGVEGQDVIPGSDGRFALKHIAHERRYVLLADKQNMQRATLTVDAGVENAALSLGRRPNELRGRIIGGLERLPIARGQPRLAYVNTVWPGGRKFHYEAAVEVRNGVGYFTLKNLLPTDLEVPLAGYKATLAHGLPGELVLDLSKSPEPAVKRKVIVRLLVDRDAPPAAGTLMVWSHPQHGPVTNDRLRPFVRDNQIEFDATAPGRLIITPDGLQHYWFKSYDQSIDASSDPLRINLPVLPAGAITGIIRPAAGQKLDRFTSVQAFEPLTGTTRDVHIHGLLNLADADGRFMIPPLPLDRDYLITTHDGSGGHAWQSPPIHLDAAYPMHELSIQLERGQNAELLVLDPDGQPLRQVPVALHYRYTRGVGGVAGGRTDGRGRYTFTNLSSTISQYTARISPDRDFAAQQVTLNPGGPVQVVRLERGGVFEGVIVDDATGLPLPNVHVTAIVNVDGKTFQTHAEAPTNPLGRFRFSTLPRGTFTLSFSRGDTVWDQTQGPFTSGGDSATIRLSAGRPR